MNIRISILGFFLAASQLAISAPALAQASPVKVTAWGQHYGGKVVYRYELQNLSDRPMRYFLIGLRMPKGGRDGAAELSIEPRGPRNSWWLSEQVATRPTGWGVRLYYPDES